jgi:adenylate cyclase
MSEDSANQASACRDVFVSYASQDAAVADAVVASLEKLGIRCWIAPRDVTPGSQYADEIVGAINDAKVIVLVLSEHAIASPHVGREIERAASKRRRVIALKTDAAPLTRSFEYFLSESQWIDEAALGMPGALTRLTQAVGQGLAPSSWVSPGLGVDASNPADRKRKLKFLTIHRVIAAAVFLVVAAIVVGVVVRYWPSKQGGAPAVGAISDKSIAVLPFADMSQKKDQEYFADGIAEQVLEHLARIPGLKVIGRTSSFQFRGSTLDVPSIGARIGVAHLLEGSVQRSGDTVRVTAQLISTKDGSHEWSDTYESKFDDVLKVQDAIASGLARALEIAVGDVQIPVSHRVNAAAYDLFLKGMHAFDPFTEEGCQEAIGLFTQSLQLDPKFAPAEVGIAWAYDDIGQNGWLPTELAYGRARASAMRALELDPTLGAAHTVLADVRLVYDWDWAAAQREIDAAFVSGGRTSAGLAVAARIAAATDPASEKAAILLHEAIALDPLNAEAQIVLGYWVYARTGRFSEGARWIRRGLEISPHWGTGHYFLAIDLLMDGHIDEAIDSAKAEKPDDGQFLALAAIYHAQHRSAESDAFLAKAIATNGDSWASAIAMLYAWRGEVDKAMQWLERAYTQHDEQLYMIKGEPQLRNLEKDERYRDFLQKMNLPE